MSFLKDHKLTVFSLILLALILVTQGSTNLIKNIDSNKEAQVQKTEAQEEGQVSGEVTTGNSSAEVSIENKTNPPTSENNSSNPGTCTVTRNGVTTVVPADEVNINEKSNGDISVKVDCNNSQTSNNGSNKTTVKNNVNIDVQTSN